MRFYRKNKKTVQPFSVVDVLFYILFWKFNCRINSKFDDSGRYFLSLFISVRKHVDRGRMCRL